MTASGKSLIWWGGGVGEWMLSLRAACAKLCVEARNSPQHLRLKQWDYVFSISYLTRLKNKQAPVILTQAGHLLHSICGCWFIIAVHRCGFQRWIISSTVL